MEFINSPVIAKWHIQFVREGVELDSTKFYFVGIFLHSPVRVTKPELKYKQKNKKLFYLLVKISRTQWNMLFFLYSVWILIYL